MRSGFMKVEWALSKLIFSENELSAIFTLVRSHTQASLTERLIRGIKQAQNRNYFVQNKFGSHNCNTDNI
jgi:hypothetical protein